jgi:hypothetical protein
MSAYVVPSKQINILVAKATSYAKDPIRIREPGKLSSREYTAEQAAKELWAANVISVNTRYKETEPTEGFVYKNDLSADQVTAVQLLKYLDNLEYQSCEADGWETSRAKAVCDVIRGRLIRKLPGYEDAKWGL